MLNSSKALDAVHYIFMLAVFFIQQVRLCWRKSRFCSNTLIAIFPLESFIVVKVVRMIKCSCYIWFLFYRFTSLWNDSKKRKIFWDFGSNYDLCLLMSSGLYLGLFYFIFWKDILVILGLYQLFTWLKYWKLSGVGSSECPSSPQIEKVSQL